MLDETCTAKPGAEVHIFMLPSADSMAGDQVEVASAVADFTGKFTVHADPAASPFSDALAGAAAANGGVVHFVALVYADGYTGVGAFSRLVSNGVWSQPPTDDPTAPDPLTVLLHWSTVSPLVPDPLVCRATYTNLGITNAPTKVGELHSELGDTVAFHYGIRTGTDIGFGVSVNGVFWSVTSEIHIGHSNNHDVGFVRSDEFGHIINSFFTYKKDRFVYRCPNFTWTVYYAYASDWATGGSIGHDNHNLDHHCNTSYPSSYRVTYPGNSTWTRDSGRYTKFRVGVNVFGAELTAESDNSGYTRIEYIFRPGVPNHSVCGNTGNPGVARRVFVGDQ